MTTSRARLTKHDIIDVTKIPWSKVWAKGFWNIWRVLDHICESSLFMYAEALLRIRIYRGHKVRCSKQRVPEHSARGVYEWTAAHYIILNLHCYLPDSGRWVSESGYIVSSGHGGLKETLERVGVGGMHWLIRYLMWCFLTFFTKAPMGRELRRAAQAVSWRARPGHRFCSIGQARWRSIFGPG